MSFAKVTIYLDNTKLGRNVCKICIHVKKNKTKFFLNEGNVNELI